MPDGDDVFFDDRLATVLRQRAASEAGLRTQFRQLLDLLGKDRMGQGPRPDHSLMAAAWLRMDALAEAIPAADRARMIRESGWRFRSADLALHLSEHEPEVASAALSRADLSVADWTALIPRLPVRARGFLRLRRDLPVDVEALLTRLGVHDRGLPAPSAEVSQAEPAAPRRDPPAEPIPLRQAVRPAPRPRSREDAGRSEISALVERIAQFRRERSDRSDADTSPRLPLGELAERPDRRVASFGFAADAAGRIEWATADVAPMIVGTRLFAPARLGETQDTAIERAFTRRQPISGAALTLSGAPAIAGEWTLDAEPNFHRDGHFTGYIGRFRRALPELSRERPELREADRIRQLLHELRTPVTAVQGYAEVIQQQLFGPAPHEYRALAAAIAADAARILAGFDELDRLARLETGALEIEPGECDFGAIVGRIVDQLNAVLAPRGASLSVETTDDRDFVLGIDHEEGEALAWRLLASLAAICDVGEHLVITLEPAQHAGHAATTLACTLPARLAAEENLFAATARPASEAINAGLFGAGFALRLARAEAAAAGGAMVRQENMLVLTLPLQGDAATASDTWPAAAPLR